MNIYQSLESFDPEIDSFIKAEEDRQRQGLELIASENFTSVSVLQANSSVLTNKYSEGQVGHRYYGGNENIDAIESICKKRALELFKLDPEIWDVNVQTLSGTCANFAVYTALVGKDGKIMGLSLTSGGHLSHGYQSQKRKVSATSLFFNSRQYTNGPNGQVDYDQLEADAKEFQPDLIICGASAYPQDFDYGRFRKIAGDAYLMADIAHISGLVAVGMMNNPFEHCDVVTTTTHKILRGPRSAMIFYRKKAIRDGKEIDVKTLIDNAVFPGLQGGPHNQKIAALAVALKQAMSNEYREYIQRVYDNAQTMAEEFQRLGYTLYSGGTKSHLILLCLKDVGGFEVQLVCEQANISINMNCISTDKSALRPSGIRLGTPALTTRGFGKEDFIKVCEFVHEAVELSKELSKECRDPASGALNAEEFQSRIKKEARIFDLKKRVVEFSSGFEIPVFNYRK